MKVMVCVAMGLSLMAGAAQAGDWRLITINDSGAFGVVYETIRQEGRDLSAWILAVKPIVGADGVSFVLFKTLFDCDQQESAFASVMEYAEDGASISSSSGAKAWAPVVPDSVGHATLRAVCHQETYGDTGWANPTAFVAAYRATQD